MLGLIRMANELEVYIKINEYIKELELSDSLSILFMVMEHVCIGMVDRSDLSVIKHNINEMEAGCAVMIDRLRKHASKNVDVMMKEKEEATVH